MSGSGADWSAPDAAGVRTCMLDVGARSTLRGRRLRQADRLRLDAAASWPADWQALARDWLKGSGAPRWRGLLEKAGPARSATLAPELLDALLQAGWITLEENREQGRWVPLRLVFRDFETQRQRLGLPHRTALAQRQAQLLAQPFAEPALDLAAQALAELPAALAIRRHGWLTALQRWQHEGRKGTQRDFALHAAGDTKGIPAADWNWLEQALALPDYGIDSHTPLLLLRAPLPLAAVPDFAGLTPATLAAGNGLHGRVPRWRLVENRTSFERAAAQYGAEDGVVWLPGYPPRWWQAAMRRLLALHPAPALIACDPDPAGIEIALSAGALWEAAQLAWEPWQMDPGVLDRLPALKPLTEDDRLRLDRLEQQQLPPALQALAQALRLRNAKGEQEGLW